MLTLLLIVYLNCFTIILGQDESHPCVRDCYNTEPMTCYFDWVLEDYRSMSKACYDCPYNITDCYRKDCIAADGAEIPVPTVNKQMPGPAIQICLGDTIVVDARNKLDEMPTTLHWHGIRQTKTPYMDGVPMVTQCPINLNEVFRYTFEPEDPGTYWWHSHVGCQRSGIFGALIVRTSDENLNKHKHLYDVDDPKNVILFQTWQNLSCADQFNKLEHGISSPPMSTLLINGRGRNVPFLRDGKEYFTPLTRIDVKQNVRYRIRTIADVILNCPVEISIDNHELTMISTDANDFEPVKATSYVISSGERWDFVLNANQPVGNYWIKVRGLSFCSVPILGVEAFQVAILHYEGASEIDDPPGEVTYNTSVNAGIQVNAVNRGKKDPSSIALTELTAMVDDDDSLKEKPDFQFYLVDDFYTLDNPKVHKKDLYGYFEVESSKRQFTPQMSHVTMEFPPSPLLSGRFQSDPDDWCNTTTISEEKCTNGFCSCTHVEQVPKDYVVEIVIVDQGKNVPSGNHPFHLHGTFFYVVYMERLWPNVTMEEVKQLDRDGKIKRRLNKAVVKDTVAIIGSGVTIVRYKTINPGFWLFHCHVEIHFSQGMAFVFKIGENDEMRPIPPGFPTCGDYIPDEGITPYPSYVPQRENKFDNDTFIIINLPEGKYRRSRKRRRQHG